MARINVEQEVPAQYAPSVFARMLRAITQQLNQLSEGFIQAATNAATAVPTTGTYQIGDFIRSSSPSENASTILVGYICTVAGTPGTWRELRIPVGVAFRKNALINGDFNIWQRGTSFVSAADASFSADRWVYNKTGAMVHDLSRSTDVPTVAAAGRLFNYSLLVDCTTADASIAAGDLCAVIQTVEGFNWLPLAQRIVTLSFWVKATKIGTYCVSLRNSGANRSYVAEYTVNVTDTWEFKTVTFTASPSAGTWDYTIGIGVYVTFALAGGSTFQTTASAWQTGNFFSTANQVNGCDSAANNFRLCGVQLELGSIATELEQRHYEHELALCQRYYEKTGIVLLAAAVGVYPNFAWAVDKRATPTLTLTIVTGTGAAVVPFSGANVTQKGGFQNVNNSLDDGAAVVTGSAEL